MRVDDVEWKKIEEMLEKEDEWMRSEMEKDMGEVNEMFYEEGRRVEER